MNLNFFTSQYPFKTAESFIENELPIVASQFDNVNIFPHYFDSTKSRSVPNNVNVIQLNKNDNSKLKLSYKILLFRFFLTEFYLAPNKSIFLKRYRYLLSYLKQTALKAQYIENHNLLLKKSVNYSFWMNEWALVLTFLKKRKVIDNFMFRICGVDIWDERHEGNYLPFRGLIYKYADKIWPNSKSAANYVKQKTIHPQKIEHNYFGTKDFGFGKFEDNDILTIISISNVIPLKRIHLIIEILKEVKQKVKWIHFGDGSSMNKIKSLADQELSHHQVEFKGRLEKFEDVLKYYSDYTVNLFITTSSTEGMPVTIMEALSFGVPIIATNVGGIGEMVTDKTGLLLEKDFDIKKVATFIENFKTSKYNTIEKREEIRLYWKENFEAEKNYIEFAKLLSSFR